MSDCRWAWIYMGVRPGYWNGAPIPFILATRSGLTDRCVVVVNLLAVGAACALCAFLISLRLRDRGRIRRTGALFVAMLAMMLAALYPGLYGVFGAIAIVAALVYAVSALRQMRAEHENRDDSSDG